MFKSDFITRIDFPRLTFHQVLYIGLRARNENYFKYLTLIFMSLETYLKIENLVFMP